ncbi:MAG: nucleotidyltransferase [Balneolaceae bacterium]
MNPSKDFEEFFELLNRNKVRYLLIGAYAYAIYAEPRYTKDIDIFYEREPGNANKLFKTISDFGFGSLDIQTEDFLKEGLVIQLGMPPYRIDLLNQIEGVSFEQAWKNRESAKYGEQEIGVIGKQDLIINKSSTGREQDKLDARNLKKTGK